MYKDIIKNAKDKNEVCAINNFFDKDYSWDNFINCINDAYDLSGENNGIHGVKEVVGKINFWQKLTLTLDNIDEKNFPGINDKLKKLQDLHPNESHGYFGAVSLTNKEPSTGKHSDPVDVIYCQFIGSVVWEISQNEITQKYQLNPGDIIYVPNSTMHEVISLTPRAAISFMFGA